MRRFRLTKAAKVLIMILVIALFGGGVYAGVKTGFVKTDNKETNKVHKTDKPDKGSVGYDENGNVMNVDNSNDAAINLSLDEWIGWKSIIDAENTGIFDELGVDVNISVINDATQSSNALIKGDLDAAGYTINRTAFLSNKFTEAGVDIVMPLITNYSNGGDGIIAKSNITTVDDLVDAKIGVPEFSEAQTLVVWFVNNSDLTQEEKDTIIDNLILFATPDEAAKAFFAGEIDVAATWEPYLTQAQNMSDCHVLFSTASSSNLVMDGIVFRKDFVEAHPDVVAKFIQGTLMAADMYDTEFDSIRKVMPMFSTASDEDIVANCVSAKLTTWKDNVDLLNGTAKTIYTDMCEVWASIGEVVNADIVDELFDDTYVQNVGDYFDSTATSVDTTKTVVTDENKQEVIDAVALLKKSTTVNFVANTAKFLDSSDATAKLDEFIEIAKVLDGSIIQIEGNIASDNDDESGVTLSKQRAETVKQYFVLNGISADRIVTIGNGGTKPIAPNDCEENMQQNRRTDISFKILE